MHSSATQCKQAPIVQFCANWVVVVTFIRMRVHAHHIERRHKTLQMHGFPIQTWKTLKCNNFNSKASIKNPFHQISSFDPFCVPI